LKFTKVAYFNQHLSYIIAFLGNKFTLEKNPEGDQMKRQFIFLMDAATLWSNSVSGKKRVENITLDRGGIAIFDSQNPEETYWQLTRVRK
jgi:hypothetical protein